MMNTKCTAISLTLAVCINGSAFASLFQYHDEASLHKSLTSFSREDFNSFTSDTASFGRGGSRTVGGLTLSASAPLDQRNYIDAPPVQFSEFNVDGTTVVNALIPNRWYSFTISFAEAITAFGANFANFSIDHIGTVSINNGSRDSFTVFNAGQAVEYIGFTSDKPFNSVILTVPEATGFGIDNITYGLVTEPPINEPPIADAGEDQVVLAYHNCSAWSLLDGTGSSDPDGDPLTYYWEWNSGSATGSTLLVNLPLGTNNITLYVSDGIKESSDTVTVIVADTTPPSMSISATPSILWPPTHKMEPIELTIFVADGCDPNPDVVLDSVTMNEGNHADYEIVDLHHVMLRSERSGNQQDRIYTLHYRATDTSGNSTHLNIDITVPHDRKEKQIK